MGRSRLAVVAVAGRCKAVVVFCDGDGGVGCAVMVIVVAVCCDGDGGSGGGGLVIVVVVCSGGVVWGLVGMAGAGGLL